MVLVTGSTGLVGSHLLLRLTAENYPVRAIYRTPEALAKTKNLFRIYCKDDDFEKIQWVQADITKIPSLEKAFEGVKFVYHCGALISFDPYDEEKLRKANIEGTANIVNLSLDFKIAKLCYVSSVAALGDLKPHETVIDENTEWNPERPHSDYAISKYGAEMEIWRGQQEGLKIVIVNPGIILGAGFTESGSGELFSRVAKGMKFYTRGITGYVCASDVVRAMVLLMNSEISGERFVLISENISFQEVMNLAADALRVKRPSIYAAPWLIALLSTADWLRGIFEKKRVLSKDAVRSLQSANLYSSEKIKKAMDFSFSPIKECVADVASKMKS
ncbi:MAG: NAD-dependent epimerase/dehydratase family protein [Flavobacterium sp.]|nr:MAG: NAD-dependent epimerase/dehydratase family protein [Flavobacterium sp.]